MDPRLGGYVCGVVVPVFMLISFVLMADKIKSSDIKGISCRIYRLYFPHFWWAIVYWGIHQICGWAAYNNMNALW